MSDCNTSFNISAKNKEILSILKFCVRNISYSFKAVSEDKVDVLDNMDYSTSDHGLKLKFKAINEKLAAE